MAVWKKFSFVGIRRPWQVILSMPFFKVSLSIIYLHAFQYSSEFKKQRGLDGYIAVACADEYGSIPVLVIPGKSM